MVQDELGFTPLHTACYFHPEVNVIKFVGSLDPAAALKQEKHGNTPLHVIHGCNPSPRLIKVLKRLNPAAALEENNDGKTPEELSNDDEDAPVFEDFASKVIQNYHRDLSADATREELDAIAKRRRPGAERLPGEPTLQMLTTKTRASATDRLSNDHREITLGLAVRKDKGTRR